MLLFPDSSDTWLENKAVLVLRLQFVSEDIKFEPFIHGQKHPLVDMTNLFPIQLDI